MSTPALDGLDRARTVVLLAISPLETHGPHLPVGVDAFAARYFAQTLAERLVAERAGWSAVLAPTLHLGSFTFDGVGTVGVRQRVVRDTLVDYGAALARAGFRYLLVANGHAGPGHLAALEEAAAIVSRRHRVTMASFTGRLAWDFVRGRYAAQIQARLGRDFTEHERRAFAEDAHGGWWETSLMLLLRPDLVDDSYRSLPPVRYSWLERARPNYAVDHGGRGYVGHPALADRDFAQATVDVLMSEAMVIVNGLLDGTSPRSADRSVFSRLPLFRTNFWPAAVGVAAAIGALAGGLAGLALRRGRAST